MPYSNGYEYGEFLYITGGRHKGKVGYYDNDEQTTRGWRLVVYYKDRRGLVRDAMIAPEHCRRATVKQVEKSGWTDDPGLEIIGAITADVRRQAVDSIDPSYNG